MDDNPNLFEAELAITNFTLFTVIVCNHAAFTATTYNKQKFYVIKDQQFFYIKSKKIESKIKWLPCSKF